MLRHPGSTTIPDVECYDEQRDQWEDITSMNVNRSALAACVLRDLANAREYSFLSRLEQQQQQQQHNQQQQQQHTVGCAPLTEGAQQEQPAAAQPPPPQAATPAAVRSSRRRN